ncbi:MULTISPECIES: hypothetical protein [unclassified Kitasatospora]|uniref:hypothetical protein n=1 Tax=unclassified Kitasatospora TaxID=2633591 RepID=UPI002F908558
MQYLSDRAAGSAGLRALQDWAEAEPGSADPLTVLSRADIAHAWFIRGHARAKYVRNDAWPRFFELLGQADELAARAADLAPADPTPRATAVHLARGLQVPRWEFDARWQALTACDPLHRTGHHHALQYLCAKWSGSHREMTEFAREAADRAPAGHTLTLLPFLADREKWVADDDGFDSNGLPAHLADIQERWIDAGPQPHSRIAEDHSLLAFSMSLIQRRSDAAIHFRAMGRHASTAGWNYSLTPRQAFLRARSAALRSH